MSHAVPAVDDALPAYHVSAAMPSEPFENKIHEDDLARVYGFKGGLVPGVTVYAWMIHPVVAALGESWLARGSAWARFAKPVYYEEEAVVQARVAERAAGAVSLDLAVLNSAGELCATGQAALGPLEGAVPDLARYPAAPLPEERPPASREALETREHLGTPWLHLEPATAAGFLDKYSERLPLYRGPGAPLHPAIYLDLGNRALDRNVRMNPWIHVESEVRHLGPARVGERLEMRGRVERLFEKKGHEFATLDLLLLAEGSRPVAVVRHTAIYKLRPA